MKNRIIAFITVIMLLCGACAMTTFAGSVKVDTDIEMVDLDELKSEWKKDQDFTLADPAPWNLDELKQVVDVQDPRSVAAYFIWAVTRMVDNYNDGMEMMKYLFADLEPYGSGFTEGGAMGKAGWDTYFNDRLKDGDYKWLPRAYFEGAEGENGFTPSRPLTLELYYNDTNTMTLNAQSYEQLGRLNIEYWVKSHAAGNQVNILVSQFDGSDRWYVTSGITSTTLFYDQRAGISAAARTALKSAVNDTSTESEHKARYGGASEPLPFSDVNEGDYFVDAVAWAYNNNVTKGTSDTTFGPFDSCTRGQVVTFLWRAAGEPEPESRNNPFNDVFTSDYYYKPILWAVEQGVTAGTSDYTFSPDETCSSAHIITFLYRAEHKGGNGWYEEAKSWASDNGLLSGTGIRVSPDENCPRGAVVTFLEREYND